MSWRYRYTGHRTAPAATSSVMGGTPFSTDLERGHMFAVDLLLGILVFGYIIVRQVRPRPVRSFNPRVPLILGIIGVVQLVSFVKTDHDKAALVATLAGSLVLAAVMGGFRASTVRIWSDAGVAWSRGTWITVVLW